MILAIARDGFEVGRVGESYADLLTEYGCFQYHLVRRPVALDSENLAVDFTTEK
jgi:hypothetical protein